MRLSIAILFMLILTGCASQHIKPTVHGIDNFGEVAPGIYRGGQPTAEGWDYLASLGVTDVIKLNSEGEGRDDAKRFTIWRYPIPILQQLLTEPSHYAIRCAVTNIRPKMFIHCSHGQDRTGLVVALFRLQVCGWPKPRAAAEMKEYGFHPELLGLEVFWAEAKADSK